MSQNDLVIANQSAPDFRSDLNDALQALGSLNSGSTAPSTTYANMLWYDTSNNILKMRSEADDAWIDIGTLNQSTNTFEVANLTELTETQAEDDTSTVFGLVSGERLSQAVAANAPLTKEYESSQFTPAAETPVTLAHGLGEAPKIVNWTLICTTAEDGFSVGEVVGPFTTSTFMDGNTGITSVLDSTNIEIYPAKGDLEKIIDKTGSRQNLTFGNWDMIVRAYA